ncbi:MAG TPA: protoporphyrinogen oxidase [Ilumatobacter sp.]|nr:protoporphyrinogen oxidase [Ilumatobacter sp.]
MTRVAIIGGGIAGLATAVELLDPAAGEHPFDVTVFEAADRLGGKIGTTAFGGVDQVDTGADAFLTRVPQAIDFARRVGLVDDDITSPTPASASVWFDRLHDIPGGIVLGVPASVRPFITTELLSWRGKLRAAAEPLLPRRAHGDSLGAYVRGRFGDEVHERLVDSLVGSIYATDTDHSSLAAVPQLAGLAAANRSLLIGARRQRLTAAATASGAPIFGAPRRGMAALVDAAAGYVTVHGGTIRVGTRVVAIDPHERGWQVVDGDGNSLAVDHVVLAAPARPASALLAGIAPAASELMAGVEHADIIMVRLRIPAADWPPELLGRSGYLVPKPRQRWVTAASFGSQKWEHWHPANGDQILRVSIGRDGLPVSGLSDSDALTAAVDDVSRHLRFDLQPTDTSVMRWTDAFPQYRPHHHDRVAAIEAALPHGIHVAGASYRGIGIPACIADGQRAARAIAISNAQTGEFLS